MNLVCAAPSAFCRSALSALASLSIALVLGACATTATPPASVRAEPTESERAAPEATARAQAPREDSTDPLPSADLTPDILFQLLASEVAIQRGQTSAASVAYLRLAEQTKDPRIARRATELALSEGSYDRAIGAARIWSDAAPSSSNARTTLETLYLATGRFDSAEPLLTRRLAEARAAGQLAEAYSVLQRVLLRAPDRAGAVALLERVSAPDQNVPEAWLARAIVAHSAERGDEAIAAARRAHALAPGNEQVVVTLARLIHPTGPEGSREAVALLKSFVSRRPAAAEARFQLARIHAQNGELTEARAEMEKVLAAEPDNPAPLFSLAQILYEGKQYAEAERYLRRFVGLPSGVRRDNALAYMFLAQIAEDTQRIGQAIDWLGRIDAGPQQVPALVKRASLMAKANRFEEARRMLRDAPVNNPRDRNTLTLAEAQLLREASRHSDVFDMLDKALERQPNSIELLYDHGLAAERVGKLQVMESSLRKLIQLRPDNAHAYNALGYSFADRNMRLPEALQLIEKALSLSPQDPHIIDSMGWVMFRMGRLDRAIDYLTKAYAIRPEAEIAVHLGEVLWAAGRAEEARRYFREARGREPNNETLRSTLARLNVAL